MAREIIKNKRSQVAVFIIIAVVIVAAVALFFLLFQKSKINISEPSLDSPEQYIEKCTRDAALSAAEIMMPQGGFLAPENFKMFDNMKVGYLCYTNLYYTSCKIQEPFFISHIEDEIMQNISETVDECFQRLKSEFERENYDVELGPQELKVKLESGKIRIDIDRKLVISKQGETRRFEEFSAGASSPFYNLAIVALEIANQEAKFCYFEYVGFMLLYPDYAISKQNVGQALDSSKIYSITERTSGKRLNIAIRSCSVPSGLL